MLKNNDGDNDNKPVLYYVVKPFFYIHSSSFSGLVAHY
jgi:hypothetical protein